MQQVSLQVADEVKALGDAVASIIVGAKQGLSVEAIAAAALPGLIAAVGGYAAMPADLKLVDDQAYLAYALAKALEPAPAPVA